MSREAIPDTIIKKLDIIKIISLRKTSSLSIDLFLNNVKKDKYNYIK